MPAIRLRFVLHNDVVSQGMVLYQKTSMPFTPGHVECVMPDGRYLGMHFKDPAGMQYREPGYDAGEISILPDKRLAEIFVDLPATQVQVDGFHAAAIASIGEPYDIAAFIEYALPIHAHSYNHAVCSAKMFLLLRKIGWFKWPITVPAHCLTPRDLLMVLSTHIEIKH